MFVLVCDHGSRRRIRPPQPDPLRYSDVHWKEAIWNCSSGTLSRTLQRQLRNTVVQGDRSADIEDHRYYLSLPRDRRRAFEEDPVEAGATLQHHRQASQASSVRPRPSYLYPSGETGRSAMCSGGRREGPNCGSVFDHGPSFWCSYRGLPGVRVPHRPERKYAGRVSHGLCEGCASPPHQESPHLEHALQHRLFW